MKILQINSKTFGVLQVILDNDDYERIVLMGKWSASRDRGKYYFHKRISKQNKITMHRFIMMNPKGRWVDHINGNTLDNRKENLRICSNAANLRNGRIRPNNTSGKTGVHFDKSRNKWHVAIKVMYKNKFIGRYKTLEEAINARKRAERIYWNI